MLPFYRLQISLRRLYLRLFNKSPASYRGVLDRLVEAVLVLDLEDRIVCLNLAARRLMADPRGNILGRPLRLALPGFSAPSKSTQTFQVELPDRKNGLPVQYEARFSPYTDPASGFTGRLLTLRPASRKNEQDRFALAARLQEASEFERRRIAADLHDQVGQNLTGLSLNLNLLQSYCTSENSQRVEALLKDSLALVEETTRQVRSVLTELIPPMLDEYGLAAALRWYGTQYNLRTRIAIQVLGDEFTPRLAHSVELAVFRIVQEALNNVVKHAQASYVTVRMVTDGDRRSIRVEDDGQGADPETFTRAAEQVHWGLLTMRDRAAAVGGELRIQSQPGQGTCVDIIFNGKSV